MTEKTDSGPDETRRRRPRRRSGVVVALTAAGLAMTPHPGAAEDEESLLETDFDEGPGRMIPVTDTISFGAAAEISIEADINPDLGGDEDEDESAIEPELFLNAAWQPDPRIDVVAGVELTQEFLLEQPGDDDPDFRLLLRRAYASFRDFVPGTIAVLGRQRFVDERRWIWEESLDGARVIWRNDRLALEAAAARDELAASNLLEPRDETGGNFFWGSGRLAFDDDREGMAYALLVDDRDDEDEDLLFTGVQSEGELTDAVEYWLDAAVVSGEEDARDVLGFGFDVGATWETDLALEPAFTLGFALGTGDDGEGTDGAYRQSGLQENSGSFAGIASFDYYGEVLDPELSNLMIATAGAGVRPTDDTSVDLIYHHYRQMKRDDDLRDTSLEADPNGESAALGHGLDLVAGWRITNSLGVKATGGVFLPGDAFDEDEDEPAWSVGAQLRVRF